MGRTKYGFDMTRQLFEESKNIVPHSDKKKTIYHPTVGKLGMIYLVVKNVLIVAIMLCVTILL